MVVVTFIVVLFQDLSFGGDSNASGVAALFELVRLFSRFSSQPNQNGLPRYNLVFILTGGGKLNYLGSKKLLEDQLDGVDGGLFQVWNFIHHVFLLFSLKTYNNECK